MTKQELRQSDDYKKAVEKVRSYKKGFTFTIPLYKMTEGQKNAMFIIMQDCEKEGLVESLSIGYGFTKTGFDITEETYKRL